MFRFGAKSTKELKTCHDDLQKICKYVISFYDFSVLEGKRSDDQQLEYFLDNLSKLDGRKNRSKHQVSDEQPFSLAVDIAPYPINFSQKSEARARFYQLSGYMFIAAEVLYVAGEITHKLRWGGDWNSDKDFSDQSFDDLPHYELYKIQE